MAILPATEFISVVPLLFTTSDGIAFGSSKSAETSGSMSDATESKPCALSESPMSENLNPSAPPVLPPANANRRSRRVVYVLIGLMFLTPTGFGLRNSIIEAREAQHRSGCKCHLIQFGLALHNYHEVHGTFPPAFVLGPDGQKWHSWRVLILPQLEQSPLYDEYRFDEPWDGPNNRKLIAKMPEIFACPSQPCPTNKAVLLSIGVLGCAGGGHPQKAASQVSQRCSARIARFAALSLSA